MNLIGRYIAGRYEMIEKVGNGGMATVYKAKDKILNRFVAVKVLKEEFTTDEEFIRRFNIEAQSAAGLAHPNIVSVYDVGHEDEIHFIVMELIQGKTLKEIIREEGTLPWKWSVNIAIQIASALEAAHKNNIVHRDIKPHNIIITEDGVAKVTDFGIAKAVSNSTITAFGTTIGSVHYFSPEHARGGFTDAKSDLYSLGIVMYEMLTGRVPFDADTPVSIALKHMQEKPVEPIKLNPTIPFALNQIIVKAMQKEPAARYQTATEMLKDLGLALKNPEGNFVEESTENNYTRRINTITDEMLNEKNAKKGSDRKKKENIFQKYPKLKIAVLPSILLVVFIVTIIITKVAVDAGSPKDVQIPELLGLTEAEVKEKLKDSKLEYEIASENYSKEYEAGKVMAQDPAYKANYTIKDTTKIMLTISKGTEMTNVPKVAGETSYEMAVDKLTAAKLNAEKVEETNEKIPEGTVIKQEPEANTEIAAGETVKVYVSLGSGKEQVPVNYVIGKPEADARKELEGTKLKVEVVYEEDTSKADGTVLKQSLSVGEVVEEGTKIILTVNKIAQIKQGTVNINFTYSKINRNTSETNTDVKTDTETNTVTNTTTSQTATSSEPSKHEMVIMVGSDEIKRTFTEGTAKMSETVSGKGTVEVRIKIDGSVEGYKSMNFDSENPVLDFDITVR